MENYIGRKCIVRCYGAGVFFGEVKEMTSDANGLNVRLANARKVWYWDGAAAVDQPWIGRCRMKGDRWYHGDWVCIKFETKDDGQGEG